MNTTTFQRSAPRNARRAPQIRRRLIAFLVVVTLLFAAALLRVVLLQTVEASSFSSYGESQRLRSIVLPAARGALFDRNGVELAVSVPSYSVWADPRLMKDRNAAVGQLVGTLGIEGRDLESLVQQLNSNTEFVWVKRQIDAPVADAIKALEIPGVFVLSESKRYLPGATMARSIIGTTDLDGKGSSGLELLYDDELTGTAGYIRRERDREGRSIPSGLREEVPSIPGQDLVLTIDQRLQYATEKMLLQTVDSTAAKGGMVVVMDTQNGDLLAIANVRRDPTNPDVVAISSANLALVETYEPGSVAKIIPAAGVLEEGKADINTTWTIPGKLQVHDAEITDDTVHDSTLTTAEVISQSSNIGTVLLARAIGSEKMDDYLHRFGFGESTGLGFPNETSGLLPPASKWSGTQRATISYGQGIGVTAVQLTAAMNTIANGGVYVAPRLVHSKIDTDGTERAAPAAAERRAVRKEVADDVTAMLRDVVCTGTAKTTGKVPGYQVAGKTGTAYKAQEAFPGQVDGYTDAEGRKHYYASFAGFVPAESPRVTVLVSIDEPAFEQRFGYQAAAPLFTAVAAEALRAMKVPPSGSTGC